MKKIILVLIISLCFITGCGKKYEPASGDIINYVTSTNFGTVEDMNNYSFIHVNKDKTITSGRINDKEYKKRKLSDSEYDEIVSLAFSKKFRNLDEDLSTDVSDGYNAHITVYYSDGTSFKTGGLVPDNKTFKELVNLLEKYK